VLHRFRLSYHKMPCGEAGHACHTGSNCERRHLDLQSRAHHSPPLLIRQALHNRVTQAPQLPRGGLADFARRRLREVTVCEALHVVERKPGGARRRALPQEPRGEQVVRHDQIQAAHAAGLAGMRAAHHSPHSISSATTTGVSSLTSFRVFYAHAEAMQVVRLDCYHYLAALRAHLGRIPPIFGEFP
jgi:hypothetical protein